MAVAITATLGHVPKRMVRRMRLCAAAFASLPIVLGVAQVALHPFSRGVWRVVWEAALVGGTFVAVVLAVVSAAILALSALRSRDATLVLGEGRVTVAPALGEPIDLRPAQVKSGVLRPFGRRARVELELCSGDAMFFDVLAESEAHELLGRLGQDAARSAACLSVRDPAPAVLRTAWFVVAAVVGCLILIGLLRPLLGFTSPSVVIGTLLGTYASAILAAWASRSAEIAIGLDGLVVRGPWRTRFLPLDALAEVARDDRTLELGTRLGERVRLRGDPSALATIERRVEQAREARAGGALPATLSALARGSRSIAAWRRDLGGLTRGPAFRSFATPDEDLFRVVADPARALELRIGAAIVLQGRDVPDAAEGLAATGNLAHARTRIAIERLVREELSDEAIAEALAQGVAEVDCES